MLSRERIGRAAKALDKQAPKGTNNGPTGIGPGMGVVLCKEKSSDALFPDHFVAPAPFSFQTGVFSILTQKTPRPGRRPQALATIRLNCHKPRHSCPLLVCKLPLAPILAGPQDPAQASLRARAPRLESRAPLPSGPDPFSLGGL